MKTLIVYYSYSGNTKKIAELLQKQLGADVAELKTVAPYTGSYDDVVAQGQDEINSKFTPELQPMGINPADYDTIVLGTPVWWYTFAPAMRTFLTETDLSGKQVYPFLTNGGWVGHTERDIAATCPSATVEKAIDIKFDEDRLSTSPESIQCWAEQISNAQ